MAITITVEQLQRIAGTTAPRTLMPELVKWINATCPRYGIDTPQRYAHFLAQACHETDRFSTLREYADGARYEGREDLGNTQPGDGKRFRGRGIFQTTGRANYAKLGSRKGQPDVFLRNPELLEEPEYAVWSACEYWAEHGFNDAASRPDGDRLRLKKPWTKSLERPLSPVEYISVRINGGENGLADRLARYARACQVLGVVQPAAAGATSAAAEKPPA